MTPESTEGEGNPIMIQRLHASLLRLRDDEAGDVPGWVLVTFVTRS